MTSEEASYDASAVTPGDADSAFQDEATASTKPRKKLHYEPNVEKGSSFRLSENVGPNDVDPKQLLVAVICFLFVAAVGIGVAFAIKNSDDGATYDYVSTDESSTAAVTNCESSFQSYTTDSLKLTMIVKGSITEDDIEYAEGVFSKTYMNLLKNGFDEEGDVCDPYCRSITDVNATYNEVFVAEESETENSTVALTARQVDEECNTVAELTLSVQGEYWGCDDSEFPGLFSSGERRGLAKSHFRSRFLAPNDGSCPVCSDDSELFDLAPSQEELIKALKVYITVLPTICELESVEMF